MDEVAELISGLLKPAPEEHEMTTETRTLDKQDLERRVTSSGDKDGRSGCSAPTGSLSPKGTKASLMFA